MRVRKIKHLTEAKKILRNGGMIYCEAINSVDDFIETFSDIANKDDLLSAKTFKVIDKSRDSITMKFKGETFELKITRK